MEFNELWKYENQNSLESIFAVQYSQLDNNPNGYGQAWNFHESRGFSDAYPEVGFFNEFPEGPRKEATFKVDIPQRSVSGGVIVENGTKPWQESQRKHPIYKKFTLAELITVSDRPQNYRAIEVFRYAEVLLIYAEAQARLGENASSIEALNQVKRRAAGLDYLTPSSVDVTTATPNEIIDESGWELAGEFKRWFDLVRSERVEEIAARRDPSENVTLVRQPTKAQYIAPLPIRALLGSNLVQNPEGFKIQ